MTARKATLEDILGRRCLLNVVKPYELCNDCEGYFSSAKANMCPYYIPEVMQPKQRIKEWLRRLG